jgi:hypothetical protein
MSPSGGAVGEFINTINLTESPSKPLTSNRESFSNLYQRIDNTPEQFKKLIKPVSTKDSNSFV